VKSAYLLQPEEAHAKRSFVDTFIKHLHVRKRHAGFGFLTQHCVLNCTRVRQTEYVFQHLTHTHTHTHTRTYVLQHREVSLKHEEFLQSAVVVAVGASVPLADAPTCL
jgi:hypothetical protein